MELRSWTGDILVALHRGVCGIDPKRPDTVVHERMLLELYLSCKDLHRDARQSEDAIQ